MTPNFIRSVDNIYWPLGGYSDVSAVISESEMADAVTFNGPTWYASSVYTDKGPYLLFDLTTLGYNSGQLYYVFNDKFEFVYSAKTYKSDPNSNSIYYGYLDKEKEFLENVTHGSRYFFLFYSINGPELSQFIIKENTNAQITQEYIKDIIQKNTLSKAQTTLNEVFISYKNSFNVYTLVNNLNTVNSFEELKQNPNCVSLNSLFKYSYFQPKQNTWVCFTKQDETPLYIDNIKGLFNWENRTLFDNSGYQLLFIEAQPKPYNTPINRMINGLGTPLAQNFSINRLNLVVTLRDTKLN